MTRPTAVDTVVGTGDSDTTEVTPLFSPSASSDGQPTRRGIALTVKSTGKASSHRLLLPFFLYCAAMGAVAVPKINVILALMCVQYPSKPSDSVNLQARLSNDQICSEPSVHARMARFMMCANIISGIGSAISSPRICALSDRYGRKPLLAFSALGMVFGDVISVAAGWFPHRISVYWVLMEFALGGLTGTFAASMALVQTYASDCTREDERAVAFSRLHACQYLGVALGPVSGGMFIRYAGRGDMLSVFYGATVCHVAFIVFILFGIEESLPPSARKFHKPGRMTHDETEVTRSTESTLMVKLKHCNIFRPLGILRPPPSTASEAARRDLPLLATIDGVTCGVQLGLTSILILHSQYRLGWSTMGASAFLSFTNATRIIVLALVIPAASHIGRAQRKSTLTLTTDAHPARGVAASNAGFRLAAIRIALIFECFGHFGFAMSTDTALFTISGIVVAAGAPMSPVIQSLMTTYVEPGRVGALLGAVSSLHALARSVVPALVQLVYSMTLRNSPESVFWALGALFGIMYLFTWKVTL